MAGLIDPSDAAALRLALVRARGVVLDSKDEKRVTDSVKGALAALDKACPGSIFDTEPAQFDRLLLKERG